LLDAEIFVHIADELVWTAPEASASIGNLMAVTLAFTRDGTVWSAQCPAALCCGEPGAAYAKCIRYYWQDHV